MLTTKVIASNTRAAYINACTSVCPASGKCEASSEASVCAGANNDRLIWFELGSVSV
jgi:hypothetical protein